MKKKLLVLVAVCALLLSLLPACNASEIGSLKSLTRPYIAQYECYEATFGGEDMLDKFDYIEIILVDKENLELVFKRNGGEKHKFESEYTFDNKTRELSADIWVLGFRFKETVVIENGKFTVSKPIASKQLIMKFKVK